jgi:hypothetical protein
MRSAAERGEPTTVASHPCRCGRCGAVYPFPPFRALAPVRTIAESELAANVIRWPPNVIVDVRSCARCRAPIARLARQSPG